MVARPPLKLSIEPMTLDDVPDVHRIERASFPVPWPDYAFRQELQTNRLAHYLVVRSRSTRRLPTAGLWLMVDEAHITTFAVLPQWRRRGIGGRLMVELMRLARDLGARVVTLEVRLSNQPARALYQRFGFRPVGVRPRYYSDNGEDALIMTTEPLDDARDGRPLSSRWRSATTSRLPRDAAVSGRILAVETSCDETAVAVVENGRRIVANVVASQVALHGATGGIVPEVAARAHLRWMIPVLEEARSDAGIDDWSELEAIAVTEGPGLAGSLLVGITMAKTLAWVHGPAAGAGQPPRGPHLRRVAARSRRGGEAGARVSDRRPRSQRRPHVPGRDDRPPDVPTARPDGRRRRGRGVRQGGAAARPAVPGRARRS